MTSRRGFERTDMLAAVWQGASFPPQRSCGLLLLQLLFQDDFTQIRLDLPRDVENHHKLDKSSRDLITDR